MTEESDRERIIGLGSHSGRKSYYPELTHKLGELQREIQLRLSIEQTLRDQNSRLARQQQVISELGIHSGLDESDFSESAHVITEMVSRGIDVDRISIWLFSEDTGMLDSIDLYEVALKKHSISGPLDVELFPAYKKAILADKVIDAENAKTDPRTAELNQSYLEPLSIGSMLDAGIFISGKIFGVICCEKIGHTHAWRTDEINFISSIADHTAIVLLNGIQKKEQEAKQKLEDYLVESEKMAAIADLAAGMAHEINNPLASIVQNTDLILKRLEARNPKIEEEAELAGIDLNRFHQYLNIRNIPEMLNRILNAGVRAAGIVQRLISFVSGSKLDKKSIDLNKCIEQAVQLFLEEEELAAIKKRTQFSLELTKDSVYIIGDNLGLIHALQNIFTNSIENFKKMRDSRFHAKITIKVRRIENHKIHLSITDNGAGVDNKFKKRLFEPFFSLKPSGSGSAVGLGLTVAYFIFTRTINGSMHVDDEYRDGFRINVILPEAK